MAKKIDPKAKAKRQKIYAGIGGVILLAVLAFQVPRTLKLLHQSSASASSSTTSAPSTGTTGPIAPPTLGGGNATPGTSAGVSSDGISDPGVVPSPQSGQLLAFSRFRSKDPFAQQVDQNCTSAEAGGDAAAGCASTGATGETGATGVSGTTGGSGGKPATSPPAKPTTATISVNGVSEAVRVGAQFPASSPTFVLVSLTRTRAKIGIAGGSLAGSKQTVTLKKNTPLTLMNTADGTRYVLRLVSVS